MCYIKHYPTAHGGLCFKLTMIPEMVSVPPQTPLNLLFTNSSLLKIDITKKLAFLEKKHNW
ncbi:MULTISPECIES: hypothetical protein [unclassified Okeania]|uniref:hypothetical protein n=1 Tax=unclassified Okeania TaxID=2634635 RepID=UPI0013BE3439|nr:MULTISPECIES: hypothetical protein [unclassified Okeania]NET15120.1 hypothetical protein [Okeania sp. SIO1H6]NET23039.1 hypothetical protein [Okeania sp. SIO1H5]NET96552.1 hypothetical protein [Okeania sp. SIO1H2]